MAGPDRKTSRGGRLRLFAGLSVVLGAVTLLLSSDARLRQGGAVSPGQPAGSSPGQPHAHGTPPSEKAIKDGFEPQDADARSIGIAMAVGVGVIALSIVGLFVLLGAFHRSDRAVQPLTSQQRAAIQPPGPPLQASPQYDLAASDKRAVALISTYAWLSPTHAAARIPIDRAMALVVGKPLDPAPSAVEAPR